MKGSKQSATLSTASVVVKFRLTKKEKNLFFEEAKNRGLTASELFRKLAAGIKPIEKSVKIEFHQFRAQMTFLGNLGNNLNQLTEAIHLIKKGYLTPTNEGQLLIQLLEEAKKSLQDFRNDLNHLERTIKER